MTTPTQDQINTAVESWRDTSIGVDAIAANTPAYNQVFDAIPTLEAQIFASIGTTEDDATAAEAAIDQWRDTLRAYPIDLDADAVTQLDTAIPDLKTAVDALY